MGSLNAIIQFIRNFLCCIKDVSYFTKSYHIYAIYLHWIYDTSITQRYIQQFIVFLQTASTSSITLFPLVLSKFIISILQVLQTVPFNYTTPLDVLISITQFYVVIVGTYDSITTSIYSYQQYKRIQTLFKLLPSIMKQMQQQQSTTSNSNNSDNNSNNNNNPTYEKDTYRLIYCSLVQEQRTCIRTMIVQFNCFCISISFLWLSGNSWHITKTNIIGGLPALIHALTVMNLCLMPLLYYMYMDMKLYQLLSHRMKVLVQQLVMGNISSNDIGLSTLQVIADDAYIPFYSCNYNGTNRYIKSTKANNIQLLQYEIIKIHTLLNAITTTTTTTTTGNGNDDNNNNNNTKKRIVQSDIANTIRPYIIKYQLYSYREMIYFIINSIAWYGYGVCIIVYYYPIVLQQHDLLRILLLYLHTDDADYYGNFIGDIMWTIEPIIILCSPYIIHTIADMFTTTTTNNNKKSQHHSNSKVTSNVPPPLISQDDPKTKTE